VTQDMISYVSRGDSQLHVMNNTLQEHEELKSTRTLLVKFVLTLPKIDQTLVYYLDKLRFVAVKINNAGKIPDCYFMFWYMRYYTMRYYSVCTLLSCRGSESSVSINYHCIDSIDTQDSSIS